jgi:hypothetical protein
MSSSSAKYVYVIQERRCRWMAPRSLLGLLIIGSVCRAGYDRRALAVPTEWVTR